MRAYQHATELALFALLLSVSTPAPAAVYRCIDADGTSTFSDRACEPKKSNDSKPAPSPAAESGSETPAHHPDSPREKKAAHLLDLLRIAPSEPETMLLRRTVDDAAPDLVKGLDPDNPSWTPANGRWHTVSEFVKADLRRDVQPALRSSTSQVAQIAARQYATQTSDADMDTLAAYLGTPEGTRYIAFQNEIRPVLYAALSAIEAQELPPADTPTDQELRQRRQLLYLTLEYRIAKEGTSPWPAAAGLQPGSTTVIENAVRREGAALDTLFAEYETSLPSFQAFTESATTRHFFAAAQPALRTELALSSTATTDFAEQEFNKYVTRWQAYYGPGVWVSTRNTVSIRGRTVLVSHTTVTHYANRAGGNSPELMALQCEQREEGMYTAVHRFATDYNARATAHTDIQNRCRAEQHLPPLH